MRIEIRKFETTPTYYVRIGDDIYEMSKYADMPNGICQYFGDYKKIDPPDFLPLEDVPIGIVRQISSILNYRRTIR